MGEPLLLLHGFAGTGRAWDGVIEHVDRRAYEPIAPDLRGHGEAAHRRPVDGAHAVADVLAEAPGRFVLAGYSLGGRIALRVALAAPQRVARLVLVATTAGIEDPAARAERLEADRALAARLAAAPGDAWTRVWMDQPVFAGTPPDAARTWEDDLRRNDPGALAEGLVGYSGGTMAPVWDRLGELTMPVTVVVGERDAKFRALGERLAGALSGADAPVVVPGAGLPREAPEALAAAIQRVPAG